MMAPPDARHTRTQQAELDDAIAPLSDEAALRRRVERQVARRTEFRISLAAWLVVVPVLSIVLGSLGLFWVAGVVALAWGAGVIGHGIDTYYQTGRRAARTMALTQRAFRENYGPDWADTATPGQLHAVYERTVRPIQMRKEFYIHLAAFVCINAMLWWIFAMVATVAFPWPAVVTALWGLGLLGHAAAVWGTSRGEGAVQREMERQRALIAEAGGDVGKLKNDDLMVGDDGELMDRALNEAERAAQQGRR